ncbi:MAG: histidine phosphatase family protein [Clostridiales bacterium]|nr:histidine phosphatase family protein [Clostridiales bacterium]
MLLFFVRHGDPCYDPDSLTPLGLRQAEAIGRRISRYGVDKIYSSPLKRAMQTAQPAAEMLRKEIIPLDFASEDKAWSELTALDDQGKRRWVYAHPGIQKQFRCPEVRALGMQWHTHPAFRDTSICAGMERIARESDAWLASLGYQRIEPAGCYQAVRPNRDKIALFAHGGFGTAFLSHVLGLPCPQFSQMISISHSSLTVLEFSEKEGVCLPVILTFANDGHLYHDGIPLYDRPVF